MKERVFRPKPCIDCSTEYTPRSSKSKRCESCQPQHRAEMARRSARRYRAANITECRARENSYYWNNREKCLESRRRSYLRDPDTAKRRAKEWRQNNPDRVRENSARWSRENPEARSVIQRRYADANRERIRAKNRQWWSDNPDYHHKWLEATKIRGAMLRVELQEEFKEGVFE